MFRALLITVLLVVMIPARVFATDYTESGKTPARVGINTNMNIGFFSLVEGVAVPAGCSNGNIIFIKFDAAGAGKAAYSTVLSAKAMSKKLSYLGYSVDESGNCFAFQVEIAP